MSVLIRSIFNIIVLKNVKKYFLLFILFALSISLFTPIIQVELNILDKQNKIIQKSGQFDFVYELPKNKEFQILQKRDFFSNKKLKLEKIIDNVLLKQKKDNKYNFDYFYNSVAKYTDFINKKEIFVQTAFDDNQTINNVVLSSGRKPKDALSEVVLNEKYAKLNNISVGQHIDFFNKKFEVVGLGNSVQNLSLSFYDTFAALGKFNFQNSEINLYKIIGVVYVNKKLFHNMESINIIKNYKNYLFFRFNNRNIDESKNFFKKEIYKSINYIPKITSFASDSSSGLKKNFSFFELAFIFSILLFLVFVLFALVGQLTASSFKKDKNALYFLKIQGYSSNQISFNYFLINFFYFSLAIICGYFLGFFLNNYFSNSNNKLFFTIIEFKPFDWKVFTILFSVFPLSFGLVSYSIIFYFLNKKETSNKINNLIFFKLSSIYNPLRVKLTSFFYYSSKFQIFMLFFFRNFWQKLFILIFLIFILITSFLLVCTKVASDNFLSNQTSFLQKDVKSVTKFDGISGSSFLKSHDNFIHSDTFLSEEDLLDKDTKMIEVKKLNLKVLVKNIDYSCHIGPEPKKLLDELDLACLFQKKFINSKNIDSLKIKEYLDYFKIKKIYFNTVPYNKKTDLPLLVLDFFIKNNTSGKLYFLKDKWHEFFVIDNKLEEKIPGWDFRIDDNNNYFLGKDPRDDIYYALAPLHFKKLGYKLGDIVEMDLTLNNQILKNKSNNKKHKFKIAAFVNDEFLISNNLFVDYQYLENKFIIKNEIEKLKIPFNQIISKHNDKYLHRYLILSFSLNNFNITEFLESNKINLDDMSLLNLESLNLNEIKYFSYYHFKIFQIYLLIILVFYIFVSLCFLFLLFEFLNNKNKKTISFLLTSGYRVQDLLFNFSFAFGFLLFLGVFLSFVSSYYLFSVLINYFNQLNVFFVVSDVWNYLGYFVALLVFLFLINLLYNFFYLKYEILKKKAI